MYFSLSLTVVKVMVGILLLEKASKYCSHSDTMETANRQHPSDHKDITVCGHVSSGPECPPLTRTAMRRDPVKIAKQTSLSDVERYTLVSNRIV